MNPTPFGLHGEGIRPNSRPNWLQAANYEPTCISSNEATSCRTALASPCWVMTIGTRCSAICFKTSAALALRWLIGLTYESSMAMRQT